MTPTCPTCHHLQAQVVELQAQTVELQRQVRYQNLLAAAIRNSKPTPTSMSTTQMVAARYYEFEGGMLIIELSEARHHTTESIIEDYGAGKGRLLDVRDGEISAAQLAVLPDFRDDC